MNAYPACNLADGDLRPLRDDPADWREQAACRGMETAIFFPTRGDNAGVAQARSICAGCPVRRQCLDNALADTGDRYGIRGGLTARERMGQHMASGRPIHIKQCRWCGSDFETQGRDRMCSDECRTAARRDSVARHHERYVRAS